jgi:hypothetical protein
MGVLVEDLLALARLDEVRDPHREPVDLTALAGDAVDDARAVAPDRDIELRGAGNGAVVVDGDPGQLRQVLANLVRNALVHTPAGTPVEVAVRARGGEALLEVRDHSSTASGAPIRAVAGGGPGRGWGSRSSPGSSAPTAATRTRPTPRAAARASPSCCRCAAIPPPEDRLYLPHGPVRHTGRRG